MKRILLTVMISLMTLHFVSGNEDTVKIDDDLSRLILLNFNYFNTPFPLPDLKLSTPDSRLFTLEKNQGRGIILVYMGENDPFNDELRKEMDELKTRYSGEPLLFISVSPHPDDYKDPHGFAGGKLGIITYPSYFIIDQNYSLRGSAEGIYPSLLSEDFLKILDTLILDIKSPRIINTLE